MFISDISKSRAALRIAANYAIAALICLVIGIVYELFSHGVFSVLMVGAFTVPLIFGALPNLVIGLAGFKEPGYAAENVYACGIVSLTTGFMINGVLDIFGTTNSLLKYYFIAGAFFTLLGAVLYFIQRRPAMQD